MISDIHDYRLFIEDVLHNCVVVGGKCKTNCIFCSCTAQEKSGRKNWIEPISGEDLADVVHLLDPNETIYFGEGPNFLSCEPFAHPDYISLLMKIDEYFPDTPKITTTICRNISPSDYEKLLASNISFVAGINTLDTVQRARLMKSRDDYEGMLRFLSECEPIIRKVSLLYTGCLDTLRRDVERIYALNSNYQHKEIMLRLPEYSIFHAQPAKELHFEALETWFDAIRLFNAEVEKPIYWLRSLSYPEDIQISRSIYSEKNERTLFDEAMSQLLPRLQNSDALLLSESVYPYFVENHGEYSNNAIEVKNHSFGGSYCTSCLLARNDFTHAISEHAHRNFNRYFINKEMFSKFNKDVMGFNLKWDYPGTIRAV